MRNSLIWKTGVTLEHLFQNQIARFWPICFLWHWLPKNNLVFKAVSSFFGPSYFETALSIFKNLKSNTFHAIKKLNKTRHLDKFVHPFFLVCFRILKNVASNFSYSRVWNKRTPLIKRSPMENLAKRIIVAPSLPYTMKSGIRP